MGANRAHLFEFAIQGSPEPFIHETPEHKKYNLYFASQSTAYRN